MSSQLDIGGGVGADLTAKYQKLATEYAKLRAQSAVLKRGLLEEQDRSAGLEDQIHQRDTALRKAESEMEAVLFRNQQLAKRVNILQEEAEAAQAKGKKGRWRRDTRERSQESQRDLHIEHTAETVINEELVAKITENAELKMKLGDIETTFEATLQALRERCETLEKEKIELSHGVRARETEASSEASILREESLELSKRLEEEAREAKAKEQRILLLQVQLEDSQSRVATLEEASLPPPVKEVGCQFHWVEDGAQEAQEAATREREARGLRLHQLETKCKELERDREHWRLESQLGQLRLEKAKQEEGFHQSQGGDLEEVVAAREEELKGVWEARIEELVESRLQADTRAVALHLELEASTARLLSHRKDGQRLEEEGQRLERQEQRLREEAATTQGNYEAQLSVMSEHLASMNSRLAEQEDVIQELRHQLGNPQKKKGKK